MQSFVKLLLAAVYAAFATWLLDGRGMDLVMLFWLASISFDLGSKP